MNHSQLPIMWPSFARPLTLAAAVGAGISGGALFAFSTFVMPGLRRLPAREGIAAMQQINLKAPNPLYMLALLGSAAACVVVGVPAVRRLDTTAGRYVLAGAVVYVAGTLVTLVYHVPQNDKLAPLSPTLESSARFWLDYSRNWTLGNHVRTVTSIVGSVLLTLGWRELSL